MAKSRVTPLSGISIPRAEANGLLCSYKLANVCLRALRQKPAAVHFLVDSSCLMAAMKSSRGKLSPYLANRRSQIEEYVYDWQEKYPETTVYLPKHIPGHRNVSDLGTRGLANPVDVDLGSEWQNGPGFLMDPFNKWPVSNEDFDEIPDEELLPKHRLNTVRIHEIPPLMKSMRTIFQHFNDFQKCLGTLARVLRASREASKIKGGWCGQNQQELIMTSLKKPLLPEDYENAEEIAFMLFQPEVEETLKNPPPSRKKSTNARQFSRELKGKMNFQSLSPFKHNRIWVTRGRFGSELGRILGPNQLPILPSSCSLAKVIMTSAHCEAHRGASDTCFRSRSKAWIIRAKPLAETISKNCPKCPFLWKQHLGQQMGQLPPERLHLGEKPWTAITLDLFGPYLVKPFKNSRTRIKVWPIVFTCLSTGATHIELSEGYGADPFLQAFAVFTSTRGYPSEVYTDKGSQLTRAAENVAEKSENWNWQKIEESTAKQRTKWRFAPAASQWRNGMSESRVKAFKQSLDYLMPAGAQNLTTAEFYTLLKLCCNLINDRPLGVKRANNSLDGDIIPITPNHLLLGRSSKQPPDSYVEKNDENKLTRRMKFIHEIEEQWWNLWFHQIWQDLFPMNKWIEPRENLKPGDICLKGSTPSLKKGKYIVCRIKEAYPDEKGLVRTVLIQYRPQDSREKSLPYVSKDLKEERISVQRLVLIVRAKDIMSDDVLLSDGNEELRVDLHKEDGGQPGVDAHAVQRVGPEAGLLVAQPAILGPQDQ